ncbi:hypothetical protein ACFE04_006646 [Oxalis oulophora]
MADVTEKSVDTEAAPTSKAPAAAGAPRTLPLSHVDVVLRVLLFAFSLVAVVLMVTSKQTEYVYVAAYKITLPLAAKFQNSPAFIYFVVALSVAGLYSIITALASISVIFKPQNSAKFLLQFAFWDVIVLGIVASATGTAGAVGYIGLKGNEHVSWNKICNTYDKFCRHVGASVLISLLASIILVLLITLSVISLYKKIPK